MKNKTLVLGATPNPSRVAYQAVHTLLRAEIPFELVGIKKGEVAGQEIIREKEPLEGIETITLYIGPRHQPEWYDFIFACKPKRIIFNPGTENAELMREAEARGILWEAACTLVLLGTGQYAL